MNVTFKIFKRLYQHYSEKNKKMSRETKEELLFELYEIITSEEYSESSINKFFKRNSTYDNKKIKSIKNKINNTIKMFDKYEIYKSLDSKQKEDEKYRDIKKIEKIFLKTSIVSLNRLFIYK